MHKVSTPAILMIHAANKPCLTRAYQNPSFGNFTLLYESINESVCIGKPGIVYLTVIYRVGNFLDKTSKDHTLSWVVRFGRIFYFLFFFIWDNFLRSVHYKNCHRRFDSPISHILSLLPSISVFFFSDN